MIPKEAIEPESNCSSSKQSNSASALPALPAISARPGKLLSMIARKLGDPLRVAQNLGQLVTQNFERQDLKELVGQSPIAGELIKQIFGVNNPTNAKAIRESARRLGIDTAADRESQS